MSNPNHISNAEISDEQKNDRLASLRKFTKQVESFGKQLEELQTAVQALGPEKIKALVEDAVSQLPIPSAAELAAALRDRLAVLDTLANQQAGLQRQQESLAGKFDQLADALKKMPTNITEKLRSEIQQQVNDFLRSIRGTLDALNEQVQSLTKATSALQKEGQQTQEARKGLSSVLKQLQEIVQSASLQNFSQVTQQMGEIQQELIIIKETVQQPSADKIQIPSVINDDDAANFIDAISCLDRFFYSHNVEELNEAERLLRSLAEKVDSNGDVKFAAEVHNYLAYIYGHKGDNRQGWEHAKAARKIYQIPKQKTLWEQIAINFSELKKPKSSPTTPQPILSAPTHP